MLSPRDLLPEVYDELRRLASARLAQEQPGNTLEATALVHEAWLRLQGAVRRVAGSQSFPPRRGDRHAANPGRPGPGQAHRQTRR